MKTLATVVATLVVLAGGAVAFMYSGIYDVAATQPHYAIVGWAAKVTKKYSIQRHAQGIKVPSLSNPALVKEGSKHYRENCARCHGAPGMKPAEMELGLRPSPPGLDKVVKKMSPAQLFWIVKHGIKMTAMPAWGPSHTDHQLWAIVAFIRKLPTLSPEEYQKMGNKEKQHAPNYEPAHHSG